LDGDMMTSSVLFLVKKVSIFSIRHSILSSFVSPFASPMSWPLRFPAPQSGRTIEPNMSRSSRLRKHCVLILYGLHLHLNGMKCR
jgi:hypothetical protein